MQVDFRFTSLGAEMMSRRYRYRRAWIRDPLSARVINLGTLGTFELEMPVELTHFQDF